MMYQAYQAFDDLAAPVRAMAGMVAWSLAPGADPGNIHLRRLAAKRALRRLVVVNGSEAYCQPCVSPVWDSALACLAMQETGGASALAASTRPR